MEPEASDVRRKFTVDEVMQMVAAGVLDEDDRVELIEGELLVMSPQDPPHASIIERLTGKLVAAYGASHRIRVQLPLLASETSLPEPDLAVVRGDERTYESRHPGGDDAVLVIEVSWSSRRRDRRKAAIYGSAGVPVYWRLDVETRRLEVNEKPASDGTYTLIRVHEESAEVEVPGTGVRWLVRDLLPHLSA
jgi:Uma2 family endonuclease